MNTSDRRLPTAEPAAGPARGSWRVVVLLMLVVGLGHFNRIAISVAGAERIIRENGIDAARMGWVYSAFLALYTLAMLPAGWFIDRVGARATLIVFCFGSAIFGIVTPIPWPTGFASPAFTDAAASFAGAARDLPSGSFMFGGFALTAFV